MKGVAPTSGFRGGCSRSGKEVLYGGEEASPAPEPDKSSHPVPSRDHLWLPASRAVQSLTCLSLAQREHRRFQLPLNSIIRDNELEGQP